MKVIINKGIIALRFAVFSICILWMCSCGRTIPLKTEKNVLGLQPLGGFNQVLMDSIKSSLEKTYSCNVFILANKPLPQEAFVQIKTSRYRADSLLRFLLRIRPDSINYMMGLTMLDISTTKKDGSGRILKPESRYRDWGVFGLGFRPGYSCVISTYRIQHKDPRIFTDRLLKICVHEFGHNLGLHHCPSPGCVMQDAVETIKTVDHGTRELCSFCRNKLNI